MFSVRFSVSIFWCFCAYFFSFLWKLPFVFPCQSLTQTLLQSQAELADLMAASGLTTYFKKNQLKVWTSTFSHSVVIWHTGKSYNNLLVGSVCFFICFCKVKCFLQVLLIVWLSKHERILERLKSPLTLSRAFRESLVVNPLKAAKRCFELNKFVFLSNKMTRKLSLFSLWNFVLIPFSSCRIFDFPKINLKPLDLVAGSRKIPPFLF